MGHRCQVVTEALNQSGKPYISNWKMWKKNRGRWLMLIQRHPTMRTPLLIIDSTVVVVNLVSFFKVKQALQKKKSGKRPLWGLSRWYLGFWRWWSWSQHWSTAALKVTGFQSFLCHLSIIEAGGWLHSLIALSRRNFAVPIPSLRQAFIALLFIRLFPLSFQNVLLV